MIILLSPAKSLDFSTKFDCSKHSQPIFLKEVEVIINSVKKFSVADLKKLMSISDNLAELNFQRFQNFDKNQTRQAIFAFDGDVYEGIDKNSIAKDSSYTQETVRILSGLYGILKPLDLIKPYRLEMGTEFKNLKFPNKNLYEFWGDKISNDLDKIDSPIVNLASQEYFSAVNIKKIKSPIINICFKEKKNGVLKIVGINSKRARGLMTNFAITNKIKDPNQLKNFKDDKYSFDKKLSDESNWFFVR